MKQIKKLIMLFLFLPICTIAQSSWNMNLLGSFDYETNHNTKCNDIWGWEDGSGNEYALVGLENGFSCVDVTNPSSPVEEFFISDIYSPWRDIKTWGNYAYVTTESDTGLLIVDLNDMTGNTYWHVSQFTNPTTGASISFTSAHNIYIDENGIAYIFGPNVASGGAVFLDVNANATSPEYLGEWTGQYIHDGMARGDTMYAGCIWAGELYVVDVSSKNNPQTLGSISTPNTFTHNAWVSDDGDYVFTTDETSDAYLAAYDISNMNNIQEVDRVQSNPGSNSIPHNTHVDGNFLITSYYRDGTTVHDITYPNHMIQVAYYDSYAGSGNGFDGCWGTYPFLSSGNIISSDRDSYNGKGVLNIYGRAFQQACYLMGNVVDGINGNNINSADVTILSTTTSAQTNIVGDYQTAVIDSGTYQVVFSTIGYISDTLSILLDNGIMTILDAQLFMIIPGCTDSLASNYNALATINDSSCIYQMTFVPDDNFENYLEANGMGDGIALNDSVLTANINTVTSLYVNNLNIADLTGIEDFTALTTLNCSYNQQLTSLDVSNNTALDTLYCNNNWLTTLDVSQNTALTYLNCWNNLLISLDVSNTALTYLVCYGNQLTNLDVSNNTALTALYCFINQLTSLNVSNNTALTNLQCQNNDLTSLDVSQNTALHILVCQNNQLTSLDLRNGNNTNIYSSSSYLNLTNNPQLYCIDVDDATYSTTNWTVANGNISWWNSFSNNCATAFGCTDTLACNYDSTATINDSSCVYLTSTSSQAACDSYTWDGVAYTTSGAYSNTYTNAAGCDSVHTLNLTINYSDTGTSAATACDTYTWEGQTVTTSQVLTHTYLGGNAVGCDSTHTLSVTINDSNTGSSSVTACDTYTWEGQTVTTSQVLTHTYLGGNAVGCDSTHTLSVTINNSPNTSGILGNIQTTSLTQETYVVSQSIGSVYNWQLSGGNIINGQNTNVLDVLWGNTSGTYILYVIETDINGCIGDTVFLSVTVGTTSNIENQISDKEKRLIKITDMLGQETPYRRNTPLFYIYDDGTVEKKIVIE